jgi:hypothetical protein
MERSRTFMAETSMGLLLSSGDAAIIHANEVEAFLGCAVGALLLTGDPAVHPEAEAVAVIGRELKQLSGGKLAVGVVNFADEFTVKQRLRLTELPTVVFVNGGRVVATVAGLQDWAVYARVAATLFENAGARR